MFINLTTYSLYVIKAYIKTQAKLFVQIIVEEKEGKLRLEAMQTSPFFPSNALSQPVYTYITDFTQKIPCL